MSRGKKGHICLIINSPCCHSRRESGPGALQFSYLQKCRLPWTPEVISFIVCMRIPFFTFAPRRFSSVTPLSSETTTWQLLITRNLRPFSWRSHGQGNYWEQDLSEYFLGGSTFGVSPSLCCPHFISSSLKRLFYCCCQLAPGVQDVEVAHSAKKTFFLLISHMMQSRYTICIKSSQPKYFCRCGCLVVCEKSLIQML